MVGRKNTFSLQQINRYFRYFYYTHNKKVRPVFLEAFVLKPWAKFRDHAIDSHWRRHRRFLWFELCYNPKREPTWRKPRIFSVLRVKVFPEQTIDDDDPIHDYYAEHGIRSQDLYFFRSTDPTWLYSLRKIKIMKKKEVSYEIASYIDEFQRQMKSETKDQSPIDYLLM